MHSLYRRLISSLRPATLYEQFAGGGYGLKEKVLGEILYIGFFLDIFNRGDQLIALVEKSSPAG